MRADRARCIAGLGILSTWTLGVVGEGHRPIAALVSVRARYFFVLTFAVNALCACECVVLPPRVRL